MEDQSYKMQPQTAAEKKTQLRKEISLAIKKATAVSGIKLLFFFLPERKSKRTFWLKETLK